MFSAYFTKGDKYHTTLKSSFRQRHARNHHHLPIFPLHSSGSWLKIALVDFYQGHCLLMSLLNMVPGASSIFSSACLGSLYVSLDSFQQFNERSPLLHSESFQVLVPHEKKFTRQTNFCWRKIKNSFLNDKSFEMKNRLLLLKYLRSKASLFRLVHPV